MTELYQPIILCAAVLVTAGAIVVLVFSLIANRGTRPGKLPEGHWMRVGVGLGVALGLPLAVPFGLATGNIGAGVALGPGMGAGIGVAIGAALERRHLDETRPLTADEKRVHGQVMRVLLALLGTAVLAGILMLVVVPPTAG